MGNGNRCIRGWVLCMATALLAATAVRNARGQTPPALDPALSDSFKVHFIARAKTPPKLDGRLDDAVWKDAAVLDDFGPASIGSRNLPWPKTEVRYLWDDTYLYVAVTAHEDTAENMDRFRRAIANRAVSHIWRDCLELHIDGNNDRHTRFQAWFNGTADKQMAWYYDFGWGLLNDWVYGLSADWDYTAMIGDAFWQTEGRIALAHIQVQPRAGYVFGMNPCRFRFYKAAVDAKGARVEAISQFLTWSTQGESHHDVRLYGKCILVDRLPATDAEGLRLAYPDLDRRTIRVQTDAGFAVFDRGKTTSQSYLDKARAGLDGARAAADRFAQAVRDEPAPGFFRSYTNSAAPLAARLHTLDTNLAARTALKVGELSRAEAEAAALATAFDDLHWTMQRALLLAEGKPRTAVVLNPPADAPGIPDEPENGPDPATRDYPAVPWARNHVGGKPRVLICVNSYAAWDAYALLQRIDLDADVWQCGGGSIGPSSDYFKEGLLLVDDKRAQLEKLLKKNTYEGFVFLATSPAAWPKDLQYWLTVRLLEGVGIAVLGNDSTWGLPGRGETDDDLAANIPRDAMTRAIPSTNGVYRNHLGDPMPPLERIEVPLNIPPVRRFALGKGRYDVFSVRHTGGYIATAISPQVEMPPDELFQAEYFCGLSCRIVLDALGRLPERRLLRVEAPGSPLPPATAGEVALLTAGPRPFAGTVRRVLRDRWGRVQASGTQKVAVTAGTNHIALAVPPLDAGDYYADAWLLDGTKVVDWASARFTVRACDGGPCRCNPSCRSLLPAPALQEISFVHRTIGPGEALAATVTVAHATSATTLRAEIRDIRGRVTERVGGITAAGGAAGIVLPSSRLWHTFQNLDVFLEQDGRVLDRRSHTFFYRHPERDDYAIFTDSDATGRILDHRQEILRGYGIQLFQGNGAPELLAKGGDITTRFWLSGSNNRTGGSLASDAYHRGVAATFRHIATQLRERNGRFVSTGDDSGVASDFASNYPNWIPPFFRRIRQKYEAAGVGATEYRRQRGLPGGGNSFFWWMDSVNVPELVSMKLQPGDLRDFTDAFREAYRTIEEFNHANGTAFASWAAITEETLPRIKPALAPDVIGFQNWLRNKYGEIAKLNAAWGVQTNSFAAIDPKLVAAQTEKGVFAPAIDKTTYLEDLFIRHMKSVAEAVHAVDPTIGIGQGAASFGNIVPEVLAHTDTIIPYIGPLDIELARALPHKWVGETIGIYGGKKVPDAMRRKQVWHGLFTGCNFSWFWSACIAGLQGDLTTNPGRSGVMLESYREVTRGPDALLLRGQRLNDGIAILHSRSSGHMTPHAQEMSTHATSKGSWQGIIEDLGLQYDYLTSAYIERGDLRKGGVRLLILPYAQALSDREAAEIRTFAEAGGCVLADLRAATFTTSGQPLAQGALDTLFGIARRQERALPVAGPLKIEGLTPEPFTLNGFRADASITAGTARAFGELAGAPALLVNTTGKGQAMLLNLAPMAYDFLLGRNELGEGRTAFRALLAKAGVQARFAARSPDGREIPGVEFAVFRRGKADYLTVEKRSFAYERYPLPAEITLDAPYWVSDVRTGRSLGRTDRIPLQLDGLGCYLFALLPYEVKNLAVKAPSSVKRGGDIVLEVAVTADAAPADLAPHVIRIETVAPDGTQPIEMRKLDTEAGRLVCSLPIAHNDQTGKWTVTATDVATGKTRTVTVNVTN